MSKNKNTTDSFSVEAIWPQWHLEVWVSYTLKCVIEGMLSSSMKCGITAISKSRKVKHAYLKTVFHSYIFKYLNRFLNLANNANLTFKITVWSARKRLCKDDVAYFWLGNPAKISASLRQDGIMVAREMINCTLAKRKVQLGAAYSMLGLPDSTGISDMDIENERQDLMSADVIFCPSPEVKASVVAYGFPSSNCIDTSYGWDPIRLAQKSVINRDDLPFTVAFAGTVDFRKGAPWMLEAWDKANINGRLLLAGRISPEVASRYKDILDRKDVICLGHVEDIGKVYHEADVFCMPTWEEGCPLVTLEAISAGCVPVVTSMGSGGAFGNLDEIGIIVPPGDVDAICNALQKLAADRTMLKHYSNRALERAQDYTWERVGESRRRELTIHRAKWIAQGRKHWSSL